MHDKAHAGLPAEPYETMASSAMTAKDERIAELEALCIQLMDDLIWCSGSFDFAPGGTARRGWVKGPQKTLERARCLLVQQKGAE